MRLPPGNPARPELDTHWSVAGNSLAFSPSPQPSSAAPSSTSVRATSFSRTGGTSGRSGIEPAAPPNPAGFSHLHRPGCPTFTPPGPSPPSRRVPHLHSTGTLTSIAPGAPPFIALSAIKVGRTSRARLAGPHRAIHSRPGCPPPSPRVPHLRLPGCPTFIALFAIKVGRTSRARLAGPHRAIHSRPGAHLPSPLVLPAPSSRVPHLHRALCD